MIAITSRLAPLPQSNLSLRKGIRFILCLNLTSSLISMMLRLLLRLINISHIIYSQILLGRRYSRILLRIRSANPHFEIGFNQEVNLLSHSLCRRREGEELESDKELSCLNRRRLSKSANSC